MRSRTDAAAMTGARINIGARKRLTMPRERRPVEPEIHEKSTYFWRSGRSLFRVMRIKTLSTLALACALVGCGGGGGGSSSGGSSANAARVGVFITDDLGAYDHVWVTVKAIKLNGPAGTRTVFSDPDGKQVDLASLNTAGASTFAFLGLGSIPEGRYTNVEVTLDDNLVLFPAGATVGQERTFEGSTGGQKLLTVLVDDSGEDIRGDDNLVIDFDLSRWNDNGATVTAFATVRDHEGLGDLHRHHGEDYHGTVSNLSSTGFTLVTRQGATPITVTTDANTQIFGDLSTLANGQRVEVRGAFSTSTRTLVATSVKIETGNNNEDEARGDVTTIGDNSFDLTVDETEGFLPSNTALHVTYTANTRFRGDRGATLTEAQFEAALASGVEVEAEGTYNEATDTLVARKLKLEHVGGDDNGGGHGGGDDNSGHG
ncbi:DUF4382 domain-containing protein [bacterium]|nr:MAG: DUF4382 domain-containing protein [bacterium]